MSAPVPVLLMIHSLGHGGSERQLANTAIGIDRSKFLPHVAAAVGGFQADAIRQAGIPILELPLRSFVKPQTLQVAAMVRRYIRENQIRLVHTFDYTLSLLGIPVARTCAGVTALSSQRFYMDLVPDKYRTPLVWTHRMAHGVVANCEEMRRHLVEDYRYPAGRVEVCYNGLDTARFSNGPRQRLPETKGAKLVAGTVCVLRKEKNVGELIEAFARVRSERPGMRLLIVGSGPEREKLIALSEALGVQDACVFLPTTANVPEVLRGMDIFVHPSHSEGLPNSVMEAMACGCAVVASRVGGCAELMDEGSGWLTKPGDVADLAAKLRDAISDDEKRERAGRNAAERMKGFSQRDATERMQAIYTKFLAG